MHHPTDMIAHTTAFGTPVVEHWLEREIGVYDAGFLISFGQKTEIIRCSGERDVALGSMGRSIDPSW